MWKKQWSWQCSARILLSQSLDMTHRSEHPVMLRRMMRTCASLKRYEYEVNMGRTDTTPPTQPARHSNQQQQREKSMRTHCPYRLWCEICLGTKSPDGHLGRPSVDTKELPVIESQKSCNHGGHSFGYQFCPELDGKTERS